MKRLTLAVAGILGALFMMSARPEPTPVPDKVADAGETGWSSRRPVMASACPHACPWGELGDFVKEALAPSGYDIVDEERAVRVLAGGGAVEVLEHYGLSPEKIEARGGSLASSMGATAEAEFDVIIDSLGSSAMNPESSQWTALSQAHDLKFLPLPEPLLRKLAAHPDYQRVTVKWGFLRGVDREFPTVARSGEVIFARAETPDESAYQIARAIDEHRSALKWYVRPYAYDPRTVWRSGSVPLHPGAARYYTEAGYMPRR